MATPLPPKFVVPVTKSETRQDPLEHVELPPLFPEPITIFSIWKYIDYRFTIPLIILHISTVYGICTTKFNHMTLIWSSIYFFASQLGVTAGYHRFWSHRSFNATPALEFLLAILGAGTMQGPIKWWVRGHRAHHRWTDTDKDPYNARRGLLFSHILWVMIKRPGWSLGSADMSDMNNNKIVQWQYKNYFRIMLFMSFAFPTMVAGLLWGDWRGGFFFAGVFRVILTQHSMFFVNSVAHWLGDAPFDDRHSPRNNFITALLTNGDGYHNFHHQFPSDYRNAIKFYQYDPSKWFILTCKYLGLASDLKTFPANEIRKGEIHMIEKRLVKEKINLSWGTEVSKLPVISFEEYEDACKSEKKRWILIEGIVYDVSDFDEHPGGASYINLATGKDMTSAFNGGIYSHSNAARNLLSMMRVAVVEYGGEVEAMKKNPSVPVFLDHVKHE